MAWGSLLGIAGGVIQGDANAQAERQQSTLQHMYQNAYGQISGLEQGAQNQLTAQQFGLAGQGYAATAQLGQALASPNMGSAGVAAAGLEGQQLGNVNAYTGGYTAQAQDRSNMGSPGYGAWGQLAMSQRYAAPLQAQQQQYQQGAAATGQQMYAQGALNTFGQQQAQIGFTSQQDTNYNNLMNSYGNLQLQQAAIADQYTGPSASFYNEQLLGQGLSLAGAGLTAYESYNGGGSDPGGQGYPTFQSAGAASAAGYN